MTVTEEQIVGGLEPIEQRYKQDYSTQDRKIFYKRYSWMTSEMWQDLCGAVLAKDYYRIPAVDDFAEMQQANPDKFPRTRRAHEPCDDCKGTGVRRFLQKRRDGKHTAPAARCDCRNGEYWQQFPSVERAKGLPGFVRLLDCHESDFGAVAAADQTVGAGEVTEEKSESKADDFVPF